MIEALGHNSLELLQTRVLVTLFEAMHGFYPAAHISIRSAIGAADALVHHPAAENSVLSHSHSNIDREESILTWCGITVLDRYAQFQPSNRSLP